MTDQVQRVWDALWQRPQLLWGLVGMLAESNPLLGPWESFGMDGRVRKDSGGRNRVRVEFAASLSEPVDTKSSRWVWRIWDSSPSPIATGHTASLAGGMAAADTYLLEHGCVLVGGIWGRNAGRWLFALGPPQRWTRYTPGGNEVAWVEEREHEGKVYFYLTVVGSSSGVAGSFELAKHEADRRLREEGWVLG